MELHKPDVIVVQLWLHSDRCWYNIVLLLLYFSHVHKYVYFIYAIFGSIFNIFHGAFPFSHKNLNQTTRGWNFMILY